MHEKIDFWTWIVMSKGVENGIFFDILNIFISQCPESCNFIRHNEKLCVRYTCARKLQPKELVTVQCYQEGISVECQMPAFRQSVLNSERVWTCLGGGRGGGWGSGRALYRRGAGAGALCREGCWAEVLYRDLTPLSRNRIRDTHGWKHYLRTPLAGGSKTKNDRTYTSFPPINFYFSSKATTTCCLLISIQTIQ